MYENRVNIDPNKYPANETQLSEAVANSIEAYRRGDVLDHAEVVALFEKRRQLERQATSEECTDDANNLG